MKKNVNVYQPGSKSVFYANFRVRVNDPRTGPRTIQVNRATGSPDRRTAQAIGNKMRDDMLLGFFDAVPKLREDSPTCGQIVDRYLATSRVKTAREVAKDFLTVAQLGAGLADRAAARLVRLSALTPDVMLSFRDGPTDTRSATTTNALMRSAKSIFSGRAREHYRHFAIPPCVDQWLKVSFLADPKSKRFRRIPEACLQEMDRKAVAMMRLAKAHGNTASGNEWRNAWACYWLMRRCGLRNSEVQELRWEWFSLREDGVFLELVRRDYWRPKGTEGEVPVAREFYLELVRAFGPSRPGAAAYVLAGTQTDRYRGTQNCVSRYVRDFLPDRPKAAYELRKQWGSEMTLRYGIETAARLLRHQGIKTAWDHYIDLLNLQAVKPL